MAASSQRIKATLGITGDLPQEFTSTKFLDVGSRRIGPRAGAAPLYVARARERRETVRSPSVAGGNLRGSVPSTQVPEGLPLVYKAVLPKRSLVASEAINLPKASA